MANTIAKLNQIIEIYREMLKKSAQVNGISAEETIALSKILDIHILKIQKLKVLKNNISKNVS